MIARVMIIIVGFSNSTRACRSVIFHSPWGNLIRPLYTKYNQNTFCFSSLLPGRPNLPMRNLNLR